MLNNTQTSLKGVIDGEQLDRHFTSSELSYLYQFNPDADNDLLDECTRKCEEDPVLQNLIQTLPDLILSYREHDFLLMHRDELNLTEEEKQQANEENQSANEESQGM